MTIDTISTERLRELAFAHEAHAKKSEWDRDIATALRALIAARELPEKWRNQARDYFHQDHDGAVMLRHHANDLAAIIGSKP